MNKIFASTLLLLIISSNVYGSTHITPTILGSGAISCGKFLGDIARSQRLKALYTNWVLGFMSGLNYGRGQDKGLNNDPDSIYYAVKKRCEEESLTGLEQATFWVYEKIDL